MHRSSFFVLLFLLLAGAPTMVHGGADEDWEYCKAGPPKISIRGCTAVLKRGDQESALNRATAFFNRGYAYSDKGDYDRAIQDYDEVIRLNPKYALAYNNRGYAYARKGDYDRAIQDYDEAIRLDPKDALAYNNRGYAYARNGDHDRAIQDYDEAIRLDPKDILAYNNRGNAYSDKGDYDRAIQDYDEAIRLNPKNALAFYNRGKAWMAKNDPAKALADYQAVHLLNPSSRSAEEGKQRALAALAAGQPTRQPVAAAQAPVLPGRRLALVMGIDTYRNIPDLETAGNDAKAVSATLRGLGFDVLNGFDLDRRSFNRRLTDFELKIRTGDSVFFFYAGHGVAWHGRNWLLPADMPEIEPGRESELAAEAFAADEIVARFKKRGAAVSVLVLDACRNNPFERPGTTRSAFGGTRGLERMSMPQGVFILYSAAEKQRAIDHLPGDDHPNSVFTRVLVDELERPDRRLVDIALDVQQRVQALVRKAGKRQLPAYYDNYAGRFTLK